eukprot:391772_1
MAGWLFKPKSSGFDSPSRIRHRRRRDSARSRSRSLSSSPTVSPRRPSLRERERNRSRSVAPAAYAETSRLDQYGRPRQEPSFLDKDNAPPRWTQVGSSQARSYLGQPIRGFSAYPDRREDGRQSLRTLSMRRDLGPRYGRRSESRRLDFSRTSRRPSRSISRESFRSSVRRGSPERAPSQSSIRSSATQPLFTNNARDDARLHRMGIHLSSERRLTRGRSELDFNPKDRFAPSRPEVPACYRVHVEKYLENTNRGQPRYARQPYEKWQNPTSFISSTHYRRAPTRLERAAPGLDFSRGKLNEKKQKTNENNRKSSSSMLKGGSSGIWEGEGFEPKSDGMSVDSRLDTSSPPPASEQKEEADTPMKEGKAESTNDAEMGNSATSSKASLLTSTLSFGNSGPFGTQSSSKPDVFASPAPLKFGAGISGTPTSQTRGASSGFSPSQQPTIFSPSKTPSKPAQSPPAFPTSRVLFSPSQNRAQVLLSPSQTSSSAFFSPAAKSSNLLQSSFSPSRPVAEPSATAFSPSQQPDWMSQKPRNQPVGSSGGGGSVEKPIEIDDSSSSGEDLNFAKKPESPKLAVFKGFPAKPIINVKSTAEKTGVCKECNFGFDEVDHSGCTPAPSAPAPSSLAPSAPTASVPSFGSLTSSKFGSSVADSLKPLSKPVFNMSSTATAPSSTATAPSAFSSANFVSAPAAASGGDAVKSTAGDAAKVPPKPSWSFTASLSAETPTVAPTVTAAPSSLAPAAGSTPAPLFSFSKPAAEKPLADKPLAAFGAPGSTVMNGIPGTQSTGSVPATTGSSFSGFSFGQSSSTPSVTATKETTSFSVTGLDPSGSSQSTSTSVAAPSFSFGSSAVSAFGVKPTASTSSTLQPGAASISAGFQPGAASTPASGFQFNLTSAANGPSSTTGSTTFTGGFNSFGSSGGSKKRKQGQEDIERPSKRQQNGFGAALGSTPGFGATGLSPADSTVNMAMGDSNQPPASGPGLFGSSGATNFGAFGNVNKPAASAFGQQNNISSSPFGQTTAAATQSSPFGQTTGATTQSSPFGSSFSQPPQQNAANPFAANQSAPSQAGGGFSFSASQSSGFGAPSTPAAFGTSNTQSGFTGFGQPTANFGTPATQSTFGAPATQSASPFGGNTAVLQRQQSFGSGVDPAGLQRQESFGSSFQAGGAGGASFQVGATKAIPGRRLVRGRRRRK